MFIKSEGTRGSRGHERERREMSQTAYLRRCMNNAKEEAISLRKQLDAAQAEIERLKADHLQTLKQLDEQKEQLDEITARNKYLEANSELQLAQWQEDTKQMLSLENMAYTVHRQLEAAILVHFHDRTLTTDEHRLLAKLERIAAKVDPYQDEHDDE